MIFYFDLFALYKWSYHAPIVGQCFPQFESRCLMMKMLRERNNKLWKTLRAVQLGFEDFIETRRHGQDNSSGEIEIYCRKSILEKQIQQSQGFFEKDPLGYGSSEWISILNSRKFHRVTNSPKMVAKSPNAPYWLPKKMPTWLYRQDFTKFPLNRHYNEEIAKSSGLLSGHWHGVAPSKWRMKSPMLSCNCSISQRVQDLWVAIGSTRMIEDEIVNDGDIINNLIDYKGGHKNWIL
ncbi:hypothetical protein TNCV_3282121 [Trichonephila clavipes]|nr:hypothetical protein TNCV_3282121 [Trichonephila clavipes]